MSLLRRGLVTLFLSQSQEKQIDCSLYGSYRKYVFKIHINTFQILPCDTLKKEICDYSNVKKHNVWISRLLIMNSSQANHWLIYYTFQIFTLKNVFNPDCIEYFFTFNKGFKRVTKHVGGIPEKFLRVSKASLFFGQTRRLVIIWPIKIATPLGTTINKSTLGRGEIPGTINWGI